MDVLQFRGNRALGEIELSNRFRNDLFRNYSNRPRQTRHRAKARYLWTRRYTKVNTATVEWDSIARGGRPCTRLQVKPGYASPNLYHGSNRESREIYSPPHLIGELHGRVSGLS